MTEPRPATREERQALRELVQKRLNSAIAGTSVTEKAMAGYFRVECILAESEQADNELDRCRDLVRHCRAELHEDGLITNEEYAEFLSDNKSTARLETYDELRGKLALTEAFYAEALERLEKYENQTT